MTALQSAEAGRFLPINHPVTDLRKLLATNMKFHRGRLGFSQEKLAQKADTAANYIASIEACRRFPSVEVLEKIAEALNIDTPELFSMESVQIYSINRLQEEMTGEITRIIADYMAKKSFLPQKPLE